MLQPSVNASLDFPPCPGKCTSRDAVECLRQVYLMTTPLVACMCICHRKKTGWIDSGPPVPEPITRESLLRTVKETVEVLEKDVHAMNCASINNDLLYNVYEACSCSIGKLVEKLKAIK